MYHTTTPTAPSLLSLTKRALPNPPIAPLTAHVAEIVRADIGACSREAEVPLKKGYTDHRKDPILAGHDSSLVTTPKRGATKQFPFKLYEMLRSAEEDIVSWQPHGRAFVVRDPKRFVKEVLPRYFAQSKIASFQRQLSLYGFVRITSGKDCNAYFHEKFLRGRPDLVQCLQRSKIKGPSVVAAVGKSQSFKEQVGPPPDFYKMEPCPPLDTLALATSSSCKNDVNVITGNSTMPGEVSRTLKTVLSGVTIDGLDDDHDEPSCRAQNATFHRQPGPSRPSESIPRPPRPQANKVFDPLRAPGRLRHQPVTAPTNLRFVTIPSQQFQSATQKRQREANRWTMALRNNRISKELIYNRWDVPLKFPQSSCKAEDADDDNKEQEELEEEEESMDVAIKPPVPLDPQAQLPVQQSNMILTTKAYQTRPPPTLEDIMFLLE